MSDAEAIFYEAFDGLERLAPGSEASTLKALGLVRSRMEPKRILDIGCGAGAQTMTLARNTRAELVAIDSHAPYLRTLEARAGKAGFSDRVCGVEASMLALGDKFSAASFDLLWAEGSIYVIGFDRGLALWRGLLREGGMLACTELSWLTASPSEAARGFWGEGYPSMRGVQANIDAAKAAGFECIAHFPLPENDWIDAYYGPLGARVSELRVKYAGDATASGVLDMIQAEIDLYQKAGHDYGYVFYVLRRQNG